MKKFLSLMLAGLMSASLFVVGAAAENPKTETVVGKAGGVLDADFTENETSSENNINVKVEAVTHKYAVDITFSFADLELGNLEWDVDNMRYNTANGDALANITHTITVSNRSDLPVYAFATVTDKDNNDGLTVAADTYSNTNRLSVAKAKASTSIGSGTGTATTGKLNVSLNSNDWTAVASYYGAKQLADNTKVFAVATVTVTISKNEK